MARSSRSIDKQSAISSLRWTGVAIIVMQFLYLIATFVSSQTTGIQTQYNLHVLLIMLGTMAILALINVLQFFIIPKGKNAYLPVMAVYYISVILFSVCVSNQYRDAVLCACQKN